VSFCSLKGDLVFFSWGVEYWSPLTPPPLFHYTSLQTKINHLIADDIREVRYKVAEQRPGFSVGSDNMGDVNHHEMCQSVIRQCTLDWSAKTEYLGGERVVGAATGENVGQAILRTLKRNGYDVKDLEEIMGDGGKNFRGKLKGAVVYIRLEPGARVITIAWCPIHRFLSCVYLFLYLFFFFLTTCFVIALLFYFTFKAHVERKRHSGYLRQ
jgi:hypothetical protein